MSDPPCRTLFEPEPQWTALQSIFQRMRAPAVLPSAPRRTDVAPAMGEMSSAKPAALIRTLSARWTQ